MAQSELTNTPTESDTDRLERLFSEIRDMVSDAVAKNATIKATCEIQIRSGRFERAVLNVPRVI